MTLPPVPAGVGPLPDAEEAIAGYLAASSGLDGVPVGDRLPTGFDSSGPAVTVDRIGGAADPSASAWRDHAHLDVRCYGPKKQKAAALSGIVRALLITAMYQDFSAYGAVVQDVVEDVGPQWFPDPGGNYPQSGYYLLQITVTVTPATATP